MATKLKIIDDVADIVPPPQIPEFVPVPTRKHRVGWTAERQRTFIERLAVTGDVGEACALAGLSSSSFYRLCNKAGADSFVAACRAAKVLASTRGSAIAWDRAINGRVERFYKDGELVMERRIPSDYLLTWLLSQVSVQIANTAAYVAPVIALSLGWLLLAEQVTPRTLEGVGVILAGVALMAWSSRGVGGGVRAKRKAPAERQDTEASDSETERVCSISGRITAA